MYEECTKGELNCINNTEAVQPSSTDHATFLAQVCPHLAGSDRVCCDTDQLNTLNGYLAQILAVFNRCPSCQANIRKYQCEIACSPNQSVFIEVVPNLDSADNTNVEKVRLYATEEWANSTLTACRDVFFPSANRPVIDINCNGYSAEKCQPEIWLNAMGNPANKFAKYTTEVVLTDNVNIDGMEPLNATVLSCAEKASPNLPSCSCQDCSAACPPGIQPTIPPEPERFTAANIDGVTFTVLVSFCGIAVLFIAGLVMYHCCRTSDDGSKIEEGNSMRKQTQITKEDVSLFEGIGKVYDDAVRKFFSKLGTYVATYPISVLAMTLTIAIPCSIGFAFAKVTTDPVELWSGPNSRARTERVYFDETFVPFQRTEQLIITANQDKYKPTQYKPWNSNETLTFGSVLNIDVLEKVSKINF